MVSPLKTTILHVRKRDLSVAPFDMERIYKAVLKAMEQTREGTEKQADQVVRAVVRDLERLAKSMKGAEFTPAVETIQDLVEEELMLHDFTKTAKAYILYREERSKVRKAQGLISPEFRKKVQESAKYFATPYNEFIYYRTYSKWVPEIGRRETWVETVDRFMAYMKENLGKKMTAGEYSEVREGILDQSVCASQRLLWSAGDACRKTNVCAYNCSYLAPTQWQDLGEIMYVLMCGAGLGFSVESENVQKFPQIKKQTGQKAPTIVVGDSKEGWADAFVAACKIWSDGKDVDIDYSQIRPAGARLKTMGGTASGPQPLKDLMIFAKQKILARQGRRLSNIDLHDIICEIGLIVVAGGVRRSALISLSDLEDKDMRDSKKGQFWMDNGQRSMANNSAVYLQKPTAEEFLREWKSLVESRTGERGIFNRGSLEFQTPDRRWKTLKNQDQVGVNPCGEIILRSKQFCNLTSIVVRPKDNLETLKRKVRVATILGTYQSTLTNFGYLSKEWKKNCDEERLLGVSITGYYDNKLVRDDKVLDILREEAIKTNLKYAKKFGINQSTSITCVKPHGNSGQMLHVGSGMHPWFAKYFIRRVRIGTNDPLLKLLIDQGVRALPEVGYSTSNTTVMVVEFPVKAPEGAITKDQVTAIDLLKEWKRIKEHFVEHNPSVTIYVADDEWLQVANFVYENWEIVGGLSFLPRSDHVYQLAPYEEINKEEYEKRIKEIKELDFSKLVSYEFDDNTEGAKEMACVSGVCSIDDVLAEEAQKDRATK